MARGCAEREICLAIVHALRYDISEKEMDAVIKSLGETLNALRRQSGYTQPRVSELLREKGIDIQPAGISKWEKGQTQPSAGQFLALCAIYGVTDVLAEFTDAPTPMSRLSAEGRRLVGDYIRVLDRSGLYARPRDCGRVLPLYNLAASAGTGQLLDGDDFEETQVDESVPGSADFGIRIAGDSMEPEIPNGAVVWVRRTQTLAPGKTGVFDYDGQAYCKRLAVDKKGAHLESLNPKYAPIDIGEGSFYTFGEVVAVSR